MANTLESHVLLHVVDKYGNVQILYLRNFGKDVQVETSENSSLPNNISSLQDLVDNLDKMAFQSGDDLVRLGNTGQEFEFDDTPMSEINDDVLSYSYSFSSKKVRQTTIEFELRLYWQDEVIIENPEPEEIIDFMNRMLEADKIITEIREQEGYHVY